MAFLKFNKAELVNLSYSLRREIILANKTGAFCNTSIVTCNTRRYHGLLGVPVDRFGGDKYLLLSSLDESLVLRGKRFSLGIHCYGDVYEPRGHKYIVDFDADPVPQISYKIGEMIFRKSIVLSQDTDEVLIRYDLDKAPSPVTLELRPFLAFRNMHALTFENEAARTGYAERQNGVAFRLYEGFPELNLQLSAKAAFKHAPCWYKGVTYSDEYRRGFDCREDLFVPGWFELKMKEGDSIVFSASVAEAEARSLKAKFKAEVKRIGPITSFRDQLHRNADLLICERGGRKRITAGFSWLYTGLLRETLITLPGLALHGKGNPAAFEEILDQLIADNEERLFRRTTQVGAPLRMTAALQQYIAYTGEEKHVWDKYGDTLKRIVLSYFPGCRAEVALQPSGLLWAQKDGVALSWMNAYVNGRPVTERAGYQVEANALWYNAVCFALDMEAKYGDKNSPFIRQLTPVREAAAASFQPTFWQAEAGFLADYVDNAGQHMDLRPNQLQALCLPYCAVSDEVKSAVVRIIDNELVTRRGIRTLSPRDSRYRGVYEGSQTDRDLAYQNGCTWPFLLASYIRLGFEMRGQAFLGRAEWLVKGFFEDLGKHGVGAFSELYDGDPPHEPHGAISSALTTAALLQIVSLIDQYREEQP